jgi:transcriptional regulator with XRE-family HTH domain
VGPEAVFRRRVRDLIAQKYRSLDRFYLETDFSKGHLSDILRGRGSPSLTTITRLAKLLDVEVLDLFLLPERDQRDRAVELLVHARPEVVRQALAFLTKLAGKD